MATKPEAHEYHGSLIPREPSRLFEDNPLGDLDLKAGASRACALGHDWPQDEDTTLGARACRRCGKPSAIPPGQVCTHGVPHAGEFGGHSCEYTDARDALIQYAALAADRDTAAVGDTSADAWDRRFHWHMERLMALARRVA